jgi:hypothetical protein
MNRREVMEAVGRARALERAGISAPDIEQLRRISMTLHRWHERECGTDDGCIERDELTGKTFWLSSYSGRRTSIPDRETGARKRLAAVMARYPALRAYVQGDPRGCALYILRPEDAPVGAEDSHYSRGLAIY